MNYNGTISPNGSCEVTCDLCGEKYTASSGEAEAIGWSSHHVWACPKNEELRGVVEIIPLKVERYSIGGEVAPVQISPAFERTIRRFFLGEGPIDRPPALSPLRRLILDDRRQSNRETFDEMIREFNKQNPPRDVVIVRLPAWLLASPGGARLA